MTDEEHDYEPIRVGIERYDDATITVPIDECPVCDADIRYTAAFSAKWGFLEEPSTTECHECGTRFELQAAVVDPSPRDSEAE